MASRVETLARHVSLASSANSSSGGSTTTSAAGAPIPRPLPAAPSSLLTVASLSPSDVVILSAVRTPICRAKRGALAGATPDALLRAVLRRVAEDAACLPGGGVASLGDICIGNVLQPGSGALSSRMAQMQAGIPYSVPLSTVNRQCSSGLMAVLHVASSIADARSGVESGIGGGVETMSLHDMNGVPDVDWDAVRACKDALACTTAMGITNENVAARYGVSRGDQDALAVRSHRLAAAARSRGAFKAEIVPVTYTSSSTGAEVTVAADDGIREGTSLATLAKLAPAFTPEGSTTAGNASQTSDGAAAVLLVSGALAQRLRGAGPRPLGVLRAWAVVGVPPDEMGVGPAVAIPAALRAARLAPQDVHVYEINEAFAAQALHCVRVLGLAPALEHEVPATSGVLPHGALRTPLINPLGGAIALGHPLGATGARQVATLLHFMTAHHLRYGVVSMCIGTGMGAAAVFEALQG